MPITALKSESEERSGGSTGTPSWETASGGYDGEPPGGVWSECGQRVECAAEVRGGAVRVVVICRTLRWDGVK